MSGASLARPRIEQQGCCVCSPGGCSACQCGLLPVLATSPLHLTDSERRARRVPKFSSATLLSMYNVSFYHKNDFSFIDGTKRVHTYTSTWSRSQMLPDHACAHTWTYKRRYAGPHCTTRTCTSASRHAVHPPCREQQQSCSATRARRLPVSHTHAPQKATTEVHRLRRPPLPLLPTAAAARRQEQA